MQIIIKNCNCLDEAIVNIDEGKLNIKYGMNGTGKSTISKAIELNTKGGDALKSLTPFKFIDKELENDYVPPSVTGAESIKSVGIFNEEYINQFVFKPDEVVSNSFDIFVRNPEYDAQMQDIENAFKEIKETFKKNEYLDQVIRDLNELSDCFGKSESGYSKAGALHKGVGSGNKIENVPIGLEPYSVFLKSSSNVKWLKWQINGKEFLDISNECPYCIAPAAEEKKEQIKLVGKEYDSKTIEHLNKILEILENLSGYFSEETNQNLLKITKNKSTISDEEISYLKEIKNNVDLLKNKLTSLRDMSFFSFKDVDKVMVMERSPSSFKLMDEEDLRQHFLVQLNGQFEGKATGETFNSEGKTDILLRDNGSNVFIAECKFWKGQKHFTEAVDQLLGYTAWRDNKTAILIFNRGTNMSTVLASVRETAIKHPNFKREISWPHESGFRFMFHNKNDVNREFYLTILVFDVPE